MTERTDDELIAALRDVEVPEPSPLFWDHFSARVRDAIAEEPAPQRFWLSRFAFVSGIVAMLAVAAIALTVTLHRTTPAPAPATAALAPTASPALERVDRLDPLDNASWDVVASVASDLNVDEVGAAGLLSKPGDVDNAITQLPQDEQQAVVELLREEIKNSKQL